MQGIRYYWVLAASRYPKDEPELPAQIHIQRALGGPIASALFTVIWGILALNVAAAQGLAYWIILFLFLDNLLVFTFGAFLPLGFTDGSTLLYWFPKLEDHSRM